jgi:predicted DNA-binding transcriptional regulator AlpA
MPRRPKPEFQDRFLDEIETAELLGISVPALQQDRWRGTLGISYRKFGSRVRYLLSEVLTWAAERRVEPPAVAVADAVDPDDVLARRPVRRGKPRRKRSAGLLEPVAEPTESI